MPSAKEIKVKIGSISSTQKITRAMEMVAASKLRTAQERNEASKPYAQKVRDVISHLAEGRLEYKHPYTITRDVKNVGYLVISTDRGLCGGLNVNLFKHTLKHMESWKQQGIGVKICTIGKKAESFFSRHGGDLLASINNLGYTPTMKFLIGVIKILLDAYEHREIDRLFVVYNEFINTMTQTPKVELLLPVSSQGQENKQPGQKNKQSGQKQLPQASWDYIYEPDAYSLLNTLFRRYIESLVYQGVVENVACEQASRMVAMKSASDNAGDLIDEFLLIYNKARQASITQELSEICAGAAAV